MRSIFVAVKEASYEPSEVLGVATTLEMAKERFLPMVTLSLYCLVIYEFDCETGQQIYSYVITEE